MLQDVLAFHRGKTKWNMNSSKKVRKMMGIISRDGYNYYNDAGIEVVHYREAGEDYDDCQSMFLVNKDIFLSQAHKLGL